MNTLMHLPGRTDVPIACDMTSAEDTPDERMAEWRELFDQALLRRERHADSVSLYFRNEPAMREQLLDLVRREHACCPFLDLRISSAGDELIWTTTNVLEGDDRAEIERFLDALHALPDHTADDMESLTDQFAEHGLNMVETSPESRHYELH
jgi:hypothetical protein